MRFSDGVTTLVTVVVVVLLSVALASALYLFFGGYLSRSAGVLGGSPPELVVESYSLYGATLTIYVANEGVGKGVIDHAYFENVATGEVVRVSLGDVVIESGRVVAVNITIPPTLSPGRYLVKLSGPGYVSPPVSVRLAPSNLGLGAYSLRVTITNTLPDPLTDYQVRVVLNSTNFDFSEANADGSDLRFYDPDAGKYLPYWIERWGPAGGEAVVWVRVPYIPPSSTKELIMYYGNPSASPMSCGPCTFDFFDDFEDGDVSDWRAYDATIEAATLGGRGVIKLVPGSATNFQHFAVPTALNLNLTSYVVEGVLYDQNPAGSFLVHYLDDGDWWGIELYNGQHIFRPVIGDSDRGWVYITRGPTPANQWFRLRVDVLPDRVVTYLNGSKVADWSIDPAYRFSGYSKVGIVEHKGYGPLYVDYMFVRKYAPQEPSVSVGP